MSKLRSIASFLKMFAADLKEEWDQMEHKFIKIVIGGTIFIVTGLFWLYFFQHSSPFKLS
ncbi:MAG: hypothetical protein HY831_00745 [Candidatus Aenigmarchaeota archaeon]|nr:hypothetical protein [Candidatus Aenigmarchaeota archaeon]